ncbi:MAG: hypothetical protein WAM11_13390 [Cyanobium sp.]
MPSTAPGSSLNSCRTPALATARDAELSAAEIPAGGVAIAGNLER